MPVTTAASQFASTAPAGSGPGAAMRAVAAKLTAHGFGVREPERPEGRCLIVTNLPGTTCDITVHDGGSVTWDYWRPGDGADPERGRVLVDDDAGLTWEPGYYTPPPHDPLTIADVIITVLGEDIADGYVQRRESVPAGTRRGNGR